MSQPKSTDKEQIDNMDTGGYLGGTTFGQTGEAEPKDTKQGGEKARPNDGKR